MIASGLLCCLVMERGAASKASGAPPSSSVSWRTEGVTPPASYRPSLSEDDRSKLPTAPERLINLAQSLDTLQEQFDEELRHLSDPVLHRRESYPRRVQSDGAARTQFTGDVTTGRAMSFELPSKPTFIEGRPVQAARSDRFIAASEAVGRQLEKAHLLAKRLEV